MYIIITTQLSFLNRLRVGFILQNVARVRVEVSKSSLNVPSLGNLGNYRDKKLYE